MHLCKSSEPLPPPQNKASTPFDCKGNHYRSIVCLSLVRVWYCKMIFKKIKVSLKAWLVLIAFFGSLPLFVYAVYLIHALGDSQQKLHDIELIERTQSIASNLDEKINSSVAFLEGIATSDAAVNTDLRALYTHSLRLNVINKQAIAITLIDINRDIVLFTKRPFGSPQFNVHDLPSVAEVFDTGKPTVSALFKSPFHEKPLFAVGAPVFQGGKVAYCLSMIYSVDVLERLIDNQNLPSDWIVWVLDRNGTVMSRSHNPEWHIGKLSNSDMMRAIQKNGDEKFEAVTSDNLKVKASLIKVNNWGLYVAIGVPKKTLNQDINKALLQLAGFCILLILASIGLSFMLANYISSHVNDIIEGTHAGNVKAGKFGPVKEFNRLAKMHHAMKEQHIISFKNIKALAEEKQAMHEALNIAKHDKLTLLPTRAYFYEKLEEMQQSLLTTPDVRLAFVFIDLDGFKQVNDEHGHVEGDKVLTETAHVIRQSIREHDLAARYGGDEFIICLHLNEYHKQDVLAQIATRIIQGVNQIGNHIGCSIGIAIWQHAHEHFDEAIQRADQMMYKAKTSGKNQYQLYFDSPI